jgi:hypothetical protein
MWGKNPVLDRRFTLKTAFFDSFKEKSRKNLKSDVGLF